MESKNELPDEFSHLLDVDSNTKNEFKDPSENDPNLYKQEDRSEKTTLDPDDEDDNDYSVIEPEQLMSTFLSDFGINEGKITYNNEDGTTEEVDFDSLDANEKLNILRSVTTPNLSKSEIEVVNYLRENNATIQDVIEHYQKKAIDEYIKSNGEIQKNHTVDDYSDEDLYIADLKSKYDSMDEDEIKSDLELAKENETLFKKKVDILRKQYKDREDEEIQRQEKEKENENLKFQENLKEYISGFNEVSMDYKDTSANALTIEPAEKEEIFAYIMKQDLNGLTNFVKDLNNPERLVELAWFALYGKEAISDISNYWKSQIKTTRKPDKKLQPAVTVKDKKENEDKSFRSRNEIHMPFGHELL